METKRLEYELNLLIAGEKKSSSEALEINMYNLKERMAGKSLVASKKTLRNPHD